MRPYNRVIRFFCLLFFLLFLILVVVWIGIDSQFNRLPSANTETPADYNLSFSNHTIQSLDGTRLALWYIPAPQSKATIILVPGHRKPKSALLSIAQSLYANNYSTVLVDLRGTGQSEGRQVYLGTKEWQDVGATYQYVKSLPESQGQKIGFLSLSIGANATIIAAGQQQIGDFLIAGVPFTDFNSLIPFLIEVHNIPAFFSPFIRLALWLELGPQYYRFTPTNYMARINQPILLIGSDKDLSVPPNDAQQLFELAYPPKEFWQSPNGHFIHTDDPEAFMSHVLNFLEKSVQ